MFLSPCETGLWQSQGQGQHAFSSGTAASLHAPNGYYLANTNTKSSSTDDLLAIERGLSTKGLSTEGYTWLPGLEARPVNNWQQPPYFGSNGTHGYVQHMSAAGDYPVLASSSYPGVGITSHNASLGISADISAIAPVHIDGLQPMNTVNSAAMGPMANGWAAVKRADASVSGAKSEVSSILQGLMDGRFVSSAKDVGHNSRNMLDTKLVSTPKRNGNMKQSHEHSTLIVSDTPHLQSGGLLHAGGSSAFYSPSGYNVNDVEALVAINKRQSEALSSACSCQ